MTLSLVPSMKLPLGRRGPSALLAAALGLGVVTALAGLAAPAFAQGQATAPGAAAPGQTPGSFGGFGGDNKQPIQIESSELEVKDKDGIAIFTGNVIAKQGDSTLETEKMIVHYAGSATSENGAKPSKAGAKAAAAPAATASEPAAPAAGGSVLGGGAQNQQIEKLEAIGKVLLTSKDQSATGNYGIYDSKAQTFVMTGNVVLTQGKNVVKGDKLTVDLVTNNAHVTSNKRVQMLLIPGQGQNGGAPGAPAAKSKTQ
ncbi:LptA/OstA family protein [Segnochrobactrum spirostomi]|uniref:LPS ABC transporter substrate-binding protein LptA n=1 Tax=Segnochrobactrum spirostomi TaxID=2608987 RepID=A0A6A7Y2L4_9HYPH|nr:LptA/OstA family protein [Segnochrobactrum spirostomi]MQT13324.1 LPS ABC transporter substrate-binding protein LptA [Segnochrobactrum spirostomi]